MNNRSVSSVVETVLVAAVVFLFISTMTLAIVGTRVPQYRQATGDELADRVVARIANGIERSLPAVDGRVTVRSRIAVPATLARTGYTVSLRSRSVVIEHPDPRIGASAAVAIPRSYEVSGPSVHSQPVLQVVVRGETGNRTVSLGDGGR